MTFIQSRRLFLLHSGVMAVGASVVRSAHAVGAPLACPPGEVPQKRTLTQTIITSEGSINLVGSGGSLKMPRMVVLETLECVPAPAPSPPPPPKPPKGTYWAPWDLLEIYTDQSWTDGLNASSYYAAVSLPGFAALSSAQPVMDITASLQNGSAVTSSHALVRDGNGFSFQNPAAVDYFMGMTARDRISAQWGLSGIGVIGTQTGSGMYGVAQYAGSLPISALSGFIQVSSGTGGSVRVKNS
jgi:hypothetical protein